MMKKKLKETKVECLGKCKGSSEIVGSGSQVTVELSILESSLNNLFTSQLNLKDRLYEILREEDNDEEKSPKVPLPILVPLADRIRQLRFTVEGLVRFNDSLINSIEL